eukprot:1685577-Prymnesium_polylepis.2
MCGECRMLRVAGVGTTTCTSVPARKAVTRIICCVFTRVLESSSKLHRGRVTIRFTCLKLNAQVSAERPREVVTRVG